MLFDLCTSLSIAVEEGGQISFIHRTFQEYLTALFLSNREIKNWGDIVEKVYKKHRLDNVVALIAEINPDKFRIRFLWPRLKDLIKEIDIVDLDKDPIAFFNLFYFTVGVDKEDNVYWTIQVGAERMKWIDLLAIIQRVYRHSIGLVNDGADWRAAFNSLVARSNLRIDEEDVEVIKLSNAIIKKTPIHSYLRALKASILELDMIFHRLENSREDLLSKMITE